MAEARRFDPDGNFHEVLEHLDTGDGSIAACTHVPAGDITGGAVICSSLYNEFLKNYRREVMLARFLASRGIAVIRFHYRGTGHSDGEPTDTTVDTMCVDASVAAARLRAVAGVDTVAFVGTRFGALVAAACSAPEAAPLALLEPIVDAERFFREGLRNILFSSVVTKQAGGSRPTKTVADLVADLERGEEIDVMGYTIGRDLFLSSLGRTLLESIGAHERPVLIVQLGAEPVRPELEKVATALEERGLPISTRAAGSRLTWWFAEEEEEAPGELENLPVGLSEEDPVLEVLGDWLQSQVGRTEPA